MAALDVYVERGSKRTFACAVDWPGWCRSGRDEDAALAALAGYASRYARAMKRRRIAFPKKGPRGGGRSLDAIARHCAEADAGYIGALGGKFRGEDVTAGARLATVRAAFLDAVAARARGEVADRGPRGGVRWLPRFAVRRSAWHWLDHAWEIEGRAGASGGSPRGTRGSTSRSR